MKRQAIPPSFHRGSAKAAESKAPSGAEFFTGRFSFAGEYPAAYAHEFSCLYHHYRVHKSLAPLASGGKSASAGVISAQAAPPAETRQILPPLSRYCLRLGAKFGGRAAADKSYDKSAGAMNVFLLTPLSPPAE